MKTLLKSTIIAGFVALTALGTVTAASANDGFGGHKYAYAECMRHERNGRDFRHDGWMKHEHGRFDRFDRQDKGGDHR
jgi:hypothetical protein